MEKEYLTLEVRELLREMSYALVEALLKEEEEFRIVIWNNNNWDYDLPKNIMDKFPNQLVLDFKDGSIQESYVDDKTGEIVLVTVFEGEKNQKILKENEIVAVLDLSGQPMILNNFPPDNFEDSYEKEEKLLEFPLSKKDVISFAQNDGISFECAERSFDSFIKNNPKLKEIFSDE